LLQHGEQVMVGGTKDVVARYENKENGNTVKN
jgi:ABC-type polysaccharide/polyol phosphate transport system ATPase subunit